MVKKTISLPDKRLQTFMDHADNYYNNFSHFVSTAVENQLKKDKEDFQKGIMPSKKSNLPIVPIVSTTI